ncbi:MAG: hypothetical protein AB9846_15830 [Tenuifilaceae bacterium]
MHKRGGYYSVIQSSFHQSLMKFVVLLYILINPFLSFSQNDTTKTKMKFDFGITRDRNINLWPIYKRTFTKFEIDKQLLFPIYRNYQNIKFGEKRSHLFPIYWKDSSKSVENLRIISTYYPSLLHITKDNTEKTRTFTLLEFAPRINLLEFKKSPDGLVMQNNLLFFLWYQNNQITQRSHLIVFPAYWHFKNRVKETTTFLPLYSYGSLKQGLSSYYAITPLFWHFQSQKKTSNLLVPLWWNKKTGVGDKATSTNLVFPVYYSHKDQKISNKVLFPIVWNFKNPRYQSLTIPPVFSKGNSADNERKHLVLTPLYWHFKSNESESTTFFPLVWSNSWKTRYENYKTLVILPVFWSQQNNDTRSQILLPFVWSKSTPFYESFTFFPLFSKGQSPDEETRHFAFTPIFWHFRSPNITSNTLFPVWWNRKKGSGEEAQSTNIIFPLYWAKKDPSYQRNIFFPLVWNFNNTEYHTFTVAPFYSKGESTDGNSSYQAISPLYWRFRTEQGKGQLFFPLWWQKDKTIEGELKSSSLVVLLYWKYKDNIRKHQGFFPVVWQLQNQTKQSFTFLPILSYGKSQDGKNGYLAATPLYWHFRNPRSTISTLFPIWWNRKVNEKNGTRHFNLLIPIYYAKWDSITSKKVLFPVIWSFKNPVYNSFTFIPFFSHGKSADQSVKHLTITPFFWHFKNLDGQTTTLLPIFWNSKYGEGESANRWNVLFPIFWSNKNINQSNNVLFPLVWSFENPNYKSLTVAPLFSFGNSSDKIRKHAIVTPLFWYIKKPKSYTKALIPIWWNSQKEEKKNIFKTNILFPLYWSFSNQNRSTKVVFPLVWNFKTPKTHSFTFAPVFSYGHNLSGKKHLVITPLFWKFDSNAEHRKILFPIFTSYKDTLKNKRFDLLFFLIRSKSNPDSSTLGVIWPIIERSKSNDYKYFRFAPLVWSKKSPSYNYFTIQPFFYHSYSKDHNTYRVLWELYTFREQIGVKKSNSILWKVATWNKYNNGDHDFRILHLLYSNSKIKGNVEKSLFPFYYLTKEDNGNRSLSVFLYFYNSLKRQIPNTKEFYQEERIFWLIRIRSNYRILKDKGIEVD